MLFTSLAAMIVICALVILGVPIIVSLIAAVIMFLFVSGGWDLALPQQTLDGLEDVVLVTLPLFILAGGIMNASSISDRLFDFAAAMFGWLRGGLAHVDIVVSVMFGGMIGTSLADLAGSASVIIPKMKAAGYPGPFAVSVSATSSGIGILIPPSSPMILYSVATGTSLGALFIAGIIPGLLLAVFLMVTVSFLARRHGWAPMQGFEWAELVRTGKRAILPLGQPAIVLGGLVFGVFTPSEAGAFAVAYGLFLALVVYRTMSLAGLRKVLVETGVLTGEIMLIVGFSHALGWAMSEARVPVMLSAFLEAAIPYDVQFLKILALLVLALIAGMILDPLIPMIMPIVLPSLLAMDADLVQFGVLMVITVIIGQLTPPVALALIVAARIGNEDVVASMRANGPFFFMLIVFLLTLIAFPSISTWLPGVLM